MENMQRTKNCGKTFQTRRQRHQLHRGRLMAVLLDARGNELLGSIDAITGNLVTDARAAAAAPLGAAQAETATDLNGQATWLFDTSGPLWHRGYFVLPRVSRAEVDAQLKQFAVKRIVVGHTTRDEIVSLYGGRVIGIDADLKDGVAGELLLWENKRLFRGLQDGRRLPLPAGNDDGTGELPKSRDD